MSDPAPNPEKALSPSGDPGPLKQISPEPAATAAAAAPPPTASATVTETETVTPTAPPASPEPTAATASATTQQEEPAAKNNGLRAASKNTNSISPSMNEMNERLRKTIDASAAPKPEIDQMLNILGDKYNLNQKSNIKGTAYNLVTFVTNYGINPDYKLDVPLTIKAFYSVFTNPQSGRPAEKYEDLAKKPAYHLICSHMMYRMVTLKMEMQLQNRSSMRYGELEEIYKRFDEFLKEGQCGKISKAAAQEAFEKEQANLLVKPGPSGDFVVTPLLENKLNYIIAILNKFVEDGMKERLQQLQVEGFDCDQMKGLLEELRSGEDSMDINVMVEKYMQLGLTPGGIKICLNKLQNQMGSHDSVAKLILMFNELKAGVTLSGKTIEDLSRILKEAAAVAACKKDCPEIKAAEQILEEIKPIVTPGPTPPSPGPTPPGPPPKKPEEPPKKPEEPPKKPEEPPQQETKGVPDGFVYYSNSNNKVQRFKDGKKDPILIAKMLMEQIKKDGVDKYLTEDGFLKKPNIKPTDEKQKYTVTNYSGQIGFVKYNKEKTRFEFEIEGVEPTEKPALEPTNKIPEPDKDHQKNPILDTFVVGGSFPRETLRQDAFEILYGKSEMPTINTKLEQNGLLNTTVFFDDTNNGFTIKESNSAIIAEDIIADASPENIGDIYMPNLPLPAPISLILQPSEATPVLDEEGNKKLIECNIIPVYDAVIVFEYTPIKGIASEQIEKSTNYYIDNSKNSQGLIEIHDKYEVVIKKGWISNTKETFEEKYAINVRNYNQEENSNDVPQLPEDFDDASTEIREKAITANIYLDIQLPEAADGFKPTSPFHIIVWLKNKRTKRPNEWVEEQDEKYRNGHFIRLIYGPGLEDKQEEQMIPSTSPKPITIKPVLDDEPGIVVPSVKEEEVSKTIRPEIVDYTVYVKEEDGSFKQAGDSAKKKIVIRKNNYKINDNNTVSFVKKSTVDGENDEEIEYTVFLEKDGPKYQVYYDPDQKKFYIDLNEKPEEPEPEPKKPEPEPEPKKPEPTPTPEPPKSVVSGKQLYSGTQTIWKEIDFQNSQAQKSGANSRGDRKNWILLYKYFNDTTNKAYYNLSRHNTLITQNMWNRLPTTPENIKEAFKTVMGNRIVDYQTLKQSIEIAKKIHAGQKTDIEEFEKLLGEKNELDSRGITDENLLTTEEKSKFAKILAFFAGLIPESWIPATNKGGSVGNRLRFMRNKK